MNYHESLKNKKIAVFTCSPKKNEVHTHNFLEFVYILKGSALHKLNDTATNICEGDYFIIDYNSRHSYELKSKDFELLNCLFLPEFIDPSLKNCRSFQMLVSSYQLRFNKNLFTASPSVMIYKDDGTVKELLFKILKEFQEERTGYLQIAHSVLVEILIVTMRKIYPDFTEYNNVIDEIIKYINSEYMNELTLGDICLKFGYSFSYLSSKIKKEIGLTFTSYLQKTRIEQSMRLLLTDKMSIYEIAESVGYRDIKSFYSAFRKFAGTTPASFKKNYFDRFE